MSIVVRSITVIVVLLAATTAAPPSPSAQAVDEHVVSDAGPLVEPHLAVDPADPEGLLVAAIKVEGPTRWRVNAWRSSDAGVTWTSVPLPGRDTSRLSADPWVGFGPEGRAYVSHLARVPIDERRTRVGIQLHRSRDAGRTFGESAIVPWGDGLSFDHPTFDIDWTTGPSRGTVHLAASQGAWTRGRMAVYRIGTSRWRVESHAPDTAGGFRYNNFNEVNGDVTVLEDGGIVYPYFEISRIIDNRDQMLAHRRLWVVMSHDGGQTFSSPFLVAEHAMGQFPRLVVDRGRSSHRGRLYMVWRGTTGDTAVYLSTSDNHGEWWSAPRRLAVSARASDSRWRTPSLAVTPDGVVAVSWYELEGDPTRGCYRVRAAVSRDGGLTFGDERIVGRVPSCPQGPRNLVGPDSAPFDVARRWPGGGDYGALAAGADGRLHVVWADARDGRFELRHSAFMP